MLLIELKTDNEAINASLIGLASLFNDIFIRLFAYFTVFMRLSYVSVQVVLELITWTLSRTLQLIFENEFER